MKVSMSMPEPTWAEKIPEDTHSQEGPLPVKVPLRHPEQGRHLIT